MWLLSVFLLLAIFVGVSGVKAVVSSSVPTPVPVQTTEFIGAFYMPKQDSLTREWASLYKWNSEGERGITRWPLLGAYSGKDTEAMNWQIKWAVEHGVSLFVFDWYWSPQKLWSTEAEKPTWGYSIDSFLGASYSSYMKFAVFFTAVHLIETGRDTLDTGRSTTEVLNIVDYWVSNYFPRANYLRINGKPVVFIDYESPFMKLGYPNILNLMRQRVRDNGYEGIFFVGMRPFGLGGDVNWYKGIVSGMEQASFDATSSYGYFFAQNNSSCSDYSSLFGSFTGEMLSYTQSLRTKFIPSLSALFDDSPTTTSFFRCINPRPSHFQDALLETKNELARQPQGAVVIGGKRLLLISSWNEWLEGSNIEPGIRLGYGGDDFSFLKAVRNVFSSGLYPIPQTPPLSRGPLSPGPFDLRPDLTFRFLFTNQNEIDKWWIQGGASALLLVEGKYGRSYATPFYSNYSGNVQGNFLAWRGTSIVAPERPKVRIKFRSRCTHSFDKDCLVSAGLISWISDKYVGPYYNTPLYSKYFISGPPAIAIPEYSEYIFDLSSHSDWQGKIQEIRLRINVDNPPARIDLEEVSFLTPTLFCPDGNFGNLDCDSEGKINQADANILLDFWTPQGPVPTPAQSRHSPDLNVDGKVEEKDLTVILDNWRI